MNLNVVTTVKFVVDQEIVKNVDLDSLMLMENVLIVKYPIVKYVLKQITVLYVKKKD